MGPKLCRSCPTLEDDYETEPIQRGTESGYSMSLSVIYRGRSILALAVVLAMGAATAKGLEHFRFFSNFNLFNNCQPMDLVVEPLAPVAAEMGLTEESIQNLVESRLRSARLYNPDPDSTSAHLYISVHIVGVTFNISLEYTKLIRVLGSDLKVTSRASITDTHGDASYILSGVSELTDDFLLKYLRVNEEACQVLLPHQIGVKTSFQ